MRVQSSALALNAASEGAPFLDTIAARTMAHGAEPHREPEPGTRNPEPNPEHELSTENREV